MSHVLTAQEVANELIKDYYDLQSRIESLVNSTKHHTSDEVEAYKDYRTRQEAVKLEIKSLINI